MFIPLPRPFLVHKASLFLAHKAVVSYTHGWLGQIKFLSNSPQKKSLLYTEANATKKLMILIARFTPNGPSPSQFVFVHQAGNISYIICNINKIHFESCIVRIPYLHHHTTLQGQSKKPFFWWVCVSW